MLSKQNIITAINSLSNKRKVFFGGRLSVCTFLAAANAYAQK